MAGRLGLPLVPVSPIRFCALPGPLYSVLMGYKESPVAEERARLVPLVCQLVDSFVADHGACLLESGPIDAVLAVPSSARPAGPPLAQVDGLPAAVCSPLGARWLEGALRRGDGPLGHMRPDRRGFAVRPSWRAEIERAHVLLLDDTYVSGARAQSAAASLRLAGARSVRIVAIGRVLRPERLAAHAAFLERLPALRGTSPCRVCAQTVLPTEKETPVKSSDMVQSSAAIWPSRPDAAGRVILGGPAIPNSRDGPTY